VVDNKWSISENNYISSGQELSWSLLSAPDWKRHSWRWHCAVWDHFRVLIDWLLCVCNDYGSRRDIRDVLCRWIRSCYC